MALTLAEAAKLSNDVLVAGVVETIVKDSPILQRMPFIEIVGNGLTYNREATAPSAAFFDVGDTWTESTPTFTQLTVALKIMGGDVPRLVARPASLPWCAVVMMPFVSPMETRWLGDFERCLAWAWLEREA